MQQFTNWGDAIMASLAAAASLFFAAIPRLVGFAVILAVGWIIASLLEKTVVALLRAVHFNVLAERAGLSRFIQQSNIKDDAAGTVGIVAKWFVRLIALVVAFDALGLPAVSEILRQLLMWLPNLVVALAILVIGGIAANAVSRLVRGAAAETGVDRPGALALFARYAVWTFAILVAIHQLGIATSLINILVLAAAGALALAAGLAFGLGGRDTAGIILRRLYEKGQANGPRIRRAGDAAANQMSMPRTDPGMERRSMLPDRRLGGRGTMQ